MWKGWIWLILIIPVIACNLEIETPSSGMQEIQKITASDGAPGDNFSYSLAIDGDRALIGAANDDDNGSDSGSAYFFHWNGSSWVEQQKITASDGAADDQFGWSVAISGDKAIVGSLYDDDNGYRSGSAYLFHWNGSSWVEQQKITASDGANIDQFGWSVAISGDKAIVGSLYDDDNGYRSGSAYLFHWNGSSWVEQQKITASDGAHHDHFGHSVAISGDKIIVGAGHKASNTGSVYLFHWNGSNWVEEQIMTASDGEAGDHFGIWVAISDDKAIAGAWHDNDKGIGSGSAYLLHWNGANWVEQQKITASDGAAGDEFGGSVAISGNKAIVGAYYDQDNGYHSGSAYLFKWNGSNWVEQQKLTASDGAVGDLFSVWVATSGGTTIVGALGDDDNGGQSGSAYIFE